ncbi:MAG: hypothetical protein RQ801_07515 [Spirochaetaceae bacterium]|nr:hypothetical protein [Spirochaetaceae bacterium]
MLAAGRLGLSGVWIPPDRIDQYKDLAGIRRLEAQEGVRLIAAVDSPQGRIEAYASPSFHYFLFAGIEDTASLPEQIAIFRDGNLIGATFADAVEEEFSILDRSLPALAYRLTDAQRVLIIGDAGLNGVRGAIRSGAREVTLVLPDLRLKFFGERIGIRRRKHPRTPRRHCRGGRLQEVYAGTSLTIRHHHMAFRTPKEAAIPGCVIPPD